MMKLTLLKTYYLIVLGFFISLNTFSQESVTLYGTVTDELTGEKVIGAAVIIDSLQIGGATNEYGFFSFSVPKGKHQLKIASLGFQEQQESITLTQNTALNIKISQSKNALKVVVISTNKNSTNIKKAEISSTKLDIKTIKKMPVVLGEVDIIKSILLLPGVTNAGEASSGFNVRGGSADQNLILLDEAIIYNSSHLFGFFSVFNPDAIKDLKLYKGGIPAKYGGRLSSVLEIYQKEGNSQSFKTNGGIGLLSSRLLIEGPIKKDKASYLFAGRSSYAHLFLKLTDNENTAFFYDVNTKLNYNINQKNSLYLSGYFGRDVFSINDSFTNTYGNTTLNIRWNHLFSEKLFANASFIYSDYFYGLDLDLVGFQWNSGIQNFNFKYDIDHFVSNKVKLTYGLNTIRYGFNPGEIEPTDATSGINPDQLEKKQALETALYIDNEHQISDRLALKYGLRWSHFLRLGEQNLNTYANNNPVTFNTALQIYEKAEPTGIEFFKKNEVIRQFSNFEPRLALAYTINDLKSIKLGYNRMSQYIHLLSNTSSPTPLDVWTPSGKYIKPQLLDQVSIGYFSNSESKAYSVEIEAFYKKIKNRIDYIDGADLIANKAIEQVILNGKARAFGAEFLVRKNNGNLTGWIAYTLSRSEQQTRGRTPLETGINNGQWYKTPYDKLHDLSVVANYKLNEKWSFAANFVLQSGQPVTYPEGFYEYQGVNIPVYGLRNENRLPIYHHLDVSATLKPLKNKNRRWKSEWVFGIYNIYNRKNAASINFRQNRVTGANKIIRLSIFGIVPSVTYNFRF